MRVGIELLRVVVRNCNYGVSLVLRCHLQQDEQGVRG